MSSKKDIPCRFYLKNSCTRGDACDFKHDPAALAAAQANAANNVANTPQSIHSTPQRFAAPVLIALKPGTPIYSIDVECVATGKEHNARAIAQIALVDQASETILNLYVNPKEDVKSYLTPLTGVTKELLAEKGVELEEALKQLREKLPKDAILVGQNIGKDVEWLKLKEGVDFAAMVDLSALLRVWNERYHSFTYFGLTHAAKCWLGEETEGQPHNAVTDAKHSIQLFLYYCRVQHSPIELASIQQRMLETPVAPSFAKANPTFEGCCMGNRKTCSCDAPFFA